LDADPVAGKAALWVSLIKSMQPSLRVLLLVSSAPTAEALEWFAAGADGCLLKSSPREAVASAIRELMEGGAPLAPLVARQLLNALQSDGAQGALGRLSLRERQVLEALAHGSAYKEIAQLLHLSLDTVRSYVRRLYTKLQVHSRGEAVSWWIRRRHLGNQSKAMMERWREA
jgi:DNA-binding NarL/FixJ family response regulator